MRLLLWIIEALLILLLALFVYEYRFHFLQNLLRSHQIQTDMLLTSPTCIQLRNLSYRHLPIARTITACIKPAPLLEGKLHLSQLNISRLDLNSIQKLSRSSSNSTTTHPISFTIDRATISATYAYQGHNEALLEASHITPDQATIETLTIKSFAGSLHAKGHYDRRLHLHGTISPSPHYLKRIAPQLNPHACKKASFTLQLDKNHLTYTLETAATNLFKELHLQLKSQGAYNFSTKRYSSRNTLNAHYRSTTLTSQLELTYDTTLTYKAKGTIQNGIYNLPIKPSFYKKIAFDLAGDLHTLKANLTSKSFSALLKLEDWKRLHCTTSSIKLGDLIALSKDLAQKRFQLQATYDKKLKATITGDLLYATIKGDRQTLTATLYPKDLGTLHLSALAPIKIEANLAHHRATLTTPLLKARFHFHDHIEGEVTIAKSRFLLHFDKTLHIKGTIPSPQALAKKLHPLYRIDLGGFDLPLSLRATYDPHTAAYRGSITSSTKAKRLQKLQFLQLDLHGQGTDLWIDYYAILFNDHAFFATRASHIRFDEGLFIDTFWIEDRLKLTGHYSDGNGAFQLKGKKYHYSSIEGAIDLDVDLAASIKGGKIAIEGALQLFGGKISWKPSRIKNVDDPDIVVVDAAHSTHPPFFLNNVSLNIKIDTQKPIIYHNEDLSLLLRPDLLIWKEYAKPLELLGIVDILKGRYTPLNDLYLISKSHLYFYSDPSDPVMQIHIKTKRNAYTIYITVNGSLRHPILIFDSDPYLSQKEILSLLVLGGSQSSLLFKAAGGAFVDALGSVFIKNMLHTFGISLDSLTFTTQGGLGFEIGKKLSDKITVLYKNDQVSTIIIRYQINDSIESEVIFGPQKNGINLFYRKVR